MNIKQAAQAALDCQDACNLSGVLHSFDDVVQNTIWPEARRLGKGTDWVNRHCVVTLFLEKLADLNRHPTSTFPIEAYDECKKLAETEPTIR